MDGRHPCEGAERGGHEASSRSSAAACAPPIPTSSIPQIHDELRYAARHDADAEPGARHADLPQQPVARRRCRCDSSGSFLPGEGVGGAGVHWNGVTWRWTGDRPRAPLALRATVRQRFIPADMPAAGLADHATTNSSRTTTNSSRPRRQRQGRQPAAAQKQRWRQRLRGSRESATIRCPPLDSELRIGDVREGARAELGYHPFPRPCCERLARLHQSGRRRASARASIAAICERFGCEANAKGSPHITVIPQAMAQSELRAAHALVGDAR